MPNYALIRQGVCNVQSQRQGTVKCHFLGPKTSQRYDGISLTKLSASKAIESKTKIAKEG